MEFFLCQKNKRPIKAEKVKALDTTAAGIPLMVP